jgi:hypothetical protein
MPKKDEMNGKDKDWKKNFHFQTFNSFLQSS